MRTIISKHYINNILICLSILFTLCIEIYNGILGIHIAIYGNIVGMVLLAITLIYYLRSVKITHIYLIILFTLLYMIINPILFYTILPYEIIFYLLVTYLFSKQLNIVDYSDIIYKIFRLYLIASILLYSYGIGVDVFSAEISRMQGLMSEPSALGLITAYVFSWSLYKKNYISLLISLYATYLSHSLVVYATIIISYIIMLYMNNNRIIVSTLISTTIIIIMYVMIINYTGSNQLLLKSIDAITFVQSGGASGYNTRAVNLDFLIDAQNRNQLSFFIGNGPNYSVYYFENLGIINEGRNIYASIFFDYGILGLLFLFMFIINSIFKVRDTNYKYLFASALAYVSINTASGIVNDIYFYSLLFYPYHRYIKR